MVADDRYLMKLPRIGHVCAGDSLSKDIWSTPQGVKWFRCTANAVVYPDSHISLRKATYAIAKLLAREQGYDFPPYQIDYAGDSVGFLWTEDDGQHFGVVRVIGAAMFERIRYRNIGDHNTLCWIWFHPYHRNRGYLTRAWPEFIARFGQFIVQPPISRAMEGFLAHKTKYMDWKRELNKAAEAYDSQTT